MLAQTRPTSLSSLLISLFYPKKSRKIHAAKENHDLSCLFTDQSNPPVASFCSEMLDYVQLYLGGACTPETNADNLLLLSAQIASGSATVIRSKDLSSKWAQTRSLLPVEKAYKEGYTEYYEEDDEKAYATFNIRLLNQTASATTLLPRLLQPFTHEFEIKFETALGSEISADSVADWLPAVALSTEALAERFEAGRLLFELREIYTGFVQTPLSSDCVRLDTAHSTDASSLCALASYKESLPYRPGFRSCRESLSACRSQNETILKRFGPALDASAMPLFMISGHAQFGVSLF